MNHLEEAKELVTRLDPKHERKEQAITHALIAIAQEQSWHNAWMVSEVVPVLSKIAEQLEEMNERNKSNDNWEENMALRKEDK